MKSLILYLSLATAVAGLLPANRAYAEEEHDFLDAPYKGLTHPKKSAAPGSNPNSLTPAPLPTASDTLAAIARQSAVKSQGARGTCSIFSATAMLEAMLVLKNYQPVTVDLSEEWLELVISEGKSSDGSTSWSNFSAFARKGSVEEQYLPYIGETWDTVEYSALSKERCGNASASEQQACLFGHNDHALLKASAATLSDQAGKLYNPEFLKARTAARAFKAQFVKLPKFASYSVNSVEEAKALLRQGIPITLDIDFFYGAWNHRTAPDHGINRDLVNYEAGLVGYPEQGSVDRKASMEEREGHSILVVGYDDNAQITTTSLMLDGTTKNFTYAGVYYFKNSWGTDKFGKNFVLNGEVHPGYGAMTQKYAEEFGGFNQLPLQ